MSIKIKLGPVGGDCIEIHVLKFGNSIQKQIKIKSRDNSTTKKNLLREPIQLKQITITN